MILRQGLSSVAAGSAIGLVLAAGGTRLFRSLLFGMPAFDPFTFAGAVALFAAVGLTACFVPCRRAAAIDAMDALRCE
jgi:ABC-type antimicrobial peptide transport system permease subunit